MTLILTKVDRGSVIQVTDRLTSQHIGEQVVPFDRQSNKNVILLTRNGILTLAYTGLAFIGQKPTDQWIAEELNGEAVPLGRSGAPATVAFRHPPRRLPEIGQAAALLRDHLEFASTQPRSELQRNPVTIVLAGWLWYRRKHPRPTAGYVTREAGGPYSIRWVTRHFGRRFWFSSCPTGHLSTDQHRGIQVGLRDKGPVEAEQWLVEHIRTAAARFDGIGSNSISITISPPHVGHVLVRYRSPSPTLATPVGVGMPTQVPVAFTPWLVSPGLIHAPSVMGGAGAETVHLGNWQVRFEAPELAIPPSPSGLEAFTQTQRRRPRL